VYFLFWNGLETVRALVGAGASVVVPARRVDHARAELDGIDRVEIDELHLDDLDSVRRFAERFLASDRKLDLLINNAGVMATRSSGSPRLGGAVRDEPPRSLRPHESPVARAHARGRRRARDRLTSAAHRISPIRFDDLQFERDPYDKWQAYGQSKTANSLFALQLDALGQDQGVRAFAVHPGGS